MFQNLLISVSNWRSDLKWYLSWNLKQEFKFQVNTLKSFVSDQHFLLNALFLFSLAFSIQKRLELFMAWNIIIFWPFIFFWDEGKCWNPRPSWGTEIPFSDQIHKSIFPLVLLAGYFNTLCVMTCNSLQIESAVRPHGWSGEAEGS